MLTREQRIGAFFVVGVILLFIAIELTLGVGLFRRRYPLYATFRDVQGLDSDEEEHEPDDEEETDPLFVGEHDVS